MRWLTDRPALARQLLDTDAVGVRREKMYKLDDHIACAVAGLTGDGLILVTIGLNLSSFQGGGS